VSAGFDTRLRRYSTTADTPNPPLPGFAWFVEARPQGARQKEEPVMAAKKKITGLIKLQINAGVANPAPPIGPALGQHGVNIMEFCKAYNAATESQRGNVIPVEITVYEDRSQVRAIAEQKQADLNANDVEAAMKIIAGTARSMGITVEA